MEYLVFGCRSSHRVSLVLHVVEQGLKYKEKPKRERERDSHQLNLPVSFMLIDFSFRNGLRIGKLVASAEVRRQFREDVHLV